MEMYGLIGEKEVGMASITKKVVARPRGRLVQFKVDQKTEERLVARAQEQGLSVPMLVKSWLMRSLRGGKLKDWKSE